MDGKWSVLCYLMALDKCYSTICHKYEQIFHRRSGGSRPEAARSLPVCTSRMSPRASLDGVTACSTPQQGGKAPQVAQGGPSACYAGEESNIAARDEGVALDQATSPGAQALEDAGVALANNGAREEFNVYRRYADVPTEDEMSQQGAKGVPKSYSLANGACCEALNGGVAKEDVARARENPAGGAAGERNGSPDPYEPLLPRNAGAHGATCAVHVPDANGVSTPHPSHRVLDARGQGIVLCQHSNGGACGFAGGTWQSDADRVGLSPARPTNGRTDLTSNGVQYPGKAARPQTLSAGTEVTGITEHLERVLTGSGAPFALPPRGLAQGMSPPVSHALGSGDLGSPVGPIGTEPRFSLREVDYAVMHSPYNKLVRKGFARLVYHDHVRERARTCAGNPHGGRDPASPPAAAAPALARPPGGPSVVSHRSFAPESGPDLVVSLLMHPPGAVAGGGKASRHGSMDLPRGVTDEVGVCP